MGQRSSGTNGQPVILIALNAKFKPLAIFKLKRDVVRVGVMMVTITVVVMGLSSHIYDHGRYSQHRRIFVLDKLTDILCDDDEE